MDYQKLINHSNMLLNPETQELACEMFKGLTNDEKKYSIMYAVSTLFESVFYMKCELDDFDFKTYHDEFYVNGPLSSLAIVPRGNCNIELVCIGMKQIDFKYTLESWRKFCELVHTELLKVAATYSSNILWENRKGGLVYGSVK